MNKLLFAALLAGSTTVMAQDCNMPTQPSIPSGDDVTMEVMSAAVADIKSYQADNQDFRSCIENKEAALGDDATDDQKALLTAAYNKSVENEEQIAILFNEQLKLMKQAEAAE